MATIYDPETGEISEEDDTIEVDLEELAASDREPNYGAAAFQGIADLVTGPYELGRSAFNAIAAHPGLLPPVSMGIEAGKYLYENPQAIAPTIGAGITAATGVANPWAGVVAAPTYSYLANRANEWMGLTPEQTGTEQIEQAIRQTVGGAAGVGTAKAIGGLTNKATGLINRFDKGRSKYTADWEEANHPGSSAAPFNAPRGSTPSENMLADDVLQYEDKFYEMNPMKGVTKTPGTTPADEMLKNLLPQKDAAKAAKATLLGQLDTVGPGIKFDDLDLRKFARPLEKAQHSAFGTGDATNQVLGTLRKSFNLPANQITHAAPGAIAPSRVQTILNTVDDAIEEIGGWDKQTRAGAVLTPSQSAKIDQLPELLKVRDSLRGAIETYSDTYSGSQGAMRDLNKTIATARTYEDLIKRHRPEVIQGMTPEFAGGRQMTSPVTPSSAWNSPTATLLNEATAGYAKDLAMAKGRIENIQNAWETPARLNRFAELRNQPYAPTPGRGFGRFNATSDLFQGVMDALAPVLPAMVSLDPGTGQIHDPNERRVAINAMQSASVPLAQQAQAISDLNAGKLPSGIKQQGPQPVQMPDVGLAYDAANNALGEEIDLESYAAETEDERILEMMDEVDYDRSGY